MKKLTICLIMYFVFIFSVKADDFKLLNDVEIEIRKAKGELVKWDKSKQESDLLTAIDILKTARENITKVQNMEDGRFLEINKELSMLYFWANKSKRVGDMVREKKEIDQFRKSVDQVTKEEVKNTSSAANKVEIVKNSESILNSAFSNQVQVSDINIPEDHPMITAAFQRALEFCKQNSSQLYECEFMFRDIYYDFPTSKSAPLANEIANRFSDKIENFTKEKLAYRNAILAKINNYQIDYSSRNYNNIIVALKEFKTKEKDKIKFDILWEMIEEFSYLQMAIDSTNELLQLRKNDAPPASVVGVKFRGFITGAEKRGLMVATEMNSQNGMIIPWNKITDEQLGKLLAILSKGEEVSYKIPVAIHLLGNTQDAFQILYQRSLDNPTIMTKYSRFYFQTLFYFRKQMSTEIDSQIESAQKLYSNKNSQGAINILTQSLLNINKNNYLRDQIGKIHSAMATFNN